MLSNKECRAVESTMRCTEFSEACFLGENESLQERIALDRSALSAVGITVQQIADILNSLLTLFRSETEPRGALIRANEEREEEGRAEEKDKSWWWVKREHKQRWRTATVQKHGIKFLLTGSGYCGHQECPYSCLCDSFPLCRNVSLGNSDLCLEKLDETGTRVAETLEFGSLLAHLIEKHAFFEGACVPYRLDPMRVVHFFALAPGVDYCGWFQTPDVVLVSQYD